MPIRINFLAEAQMLEEERRKDPVKRSIIIACGVVAAVLVWSGLQQARVLNARRELRALEAAWQTMEKPHGRVQESNRQLADMESKLSALHQYTSERLLWANMLNALQAATVENVQLTRIRGEQSFTLNEPPRPAANVPATPATSKPLTATQKVTLLLEAKDFSARSAEQVGRFKESLLNSAYFQGHVQKTNGVLLTSLSAPQTDLFSPITHVNFVLQLSYQEQERRLHE